MNDFELKILVSLLSLGLFGGFGHCGFMCGPFVLMQVNSRLQDLKIENITYLQKLKGLALIPYHLGRITTYSTLGLISSIIGKNIRDIGNINIISGIMLMLGSLLILVLVLKNFGIVVFPRKIKFKLRFFLADELICFLKSITAYLFKNPKGFNGYMLGIILGFLPCGLLYSALVIVSTLSNYLLAILGMFIFGAFTILPLLISAIGSFLFFDNLKFGFKIFGQFILLINMIILFIMALSQIKLI